MKRLISLLAVLVFAALIPAGAFAQLVWDGFYRVGGAYASLPSSANLPNEFSFTDRLRLNVSYAAADDMYGFKFRLQGDGNPTAYTVATNNSGIQNAFTTAPQYGYAYTKLLDGMIRVSAGKLDITDYEVSQLYAFDDQYVKNVYSDDYMPNKPVLGGQKGNTTGGIIQVWPVEGLSVGFYAREDGSNLNPNHLGLAAYYMIPDVGKVIFDSQLGNYYDAKTPFGNPPTGNNEEALDRSRANIGFSYTAVKGLAATLVYRIDGDTLYSEYGNVANDSHRNASSVIAIVDFDLNPLFQVPLTFDVATDSDITNKNIYIEGEFDYAIIPQLKIRGYGAYDSTDTTIVARGIGNSITTATTGIVNWGSAFFNYLYGVDLVFPVGKAEFSFGVGYGSSTLLGSGATDYGVLYFPFLVKANF